jgi:hypothetical protein
MASIDAASAQGAPMTVTAGERGSAAASRGAQVSIRRRKAIRKATFPSNFNPDGNA